MSEMKEKRNAEVKDMENGVHIILSSKTGISIEDICDKVDLLPVYFTDFKCFL
jgi:hypothetical protein